MNFDKHSGSSFDSFLKEEGIKEAVEAVAEKRLAKLTAAQKPWIDKLETAAELISAVMDKLDITTTECPHCHRMNNKEWTQTQAHKELQAIYTKLNKWAERLRKS